MPGKMPGRPTDLEARATTNYSSQLCGYFWSSSARESSVSSSVCCVSNITANSSVRVAFLLAMIVPGCGPCGIPRGCNVIEPRSEEHTSELQSHSDLVFPLLLEKTNML